MRVVGQLNFRCVAILGVLLPATISGCFDVQADDGPFRSATVDEAQALADIDLPSGQANFEAKIQLGEEADTLILRTELTRRQFAGVFNSGRFEGELELGPNRLSDRPLFDVPGSESARILTLVEDAAETPALTRRLVVYPRGGGTFTLLMEAEA